MDDRILAYYDDSEVGELGDHQGYHAVLRIGRSKTNKGGLHFFIDEYDGSYHMDGMAVYVPDAAAFLAPVVEWLNGGAE